MVDPDRGLFSCLRTSGPALTECLIRGPCRSTRCWGLCGGLCGSTGVPCSLPPATSTTTRPCSFIKRLMWLWGVGCCCFLRLYSITSLLMVLSVVIVYSLLLACSHHSFLRPGRALSEAAPTVLSTMPESLLSPPAPKWWGRLLVQLCRQIWTFLDYFIESETKADVEMKRLGGPKSRTRCRRWQRPRLTLVPTVLQWRPSDRESPHWCWGGCLWLEEREKKDVISSAGTSWKRHCLLQGALQVTVHLNVAVAQIHAQLVQPFDQPPPVRSSQRLHAQRGDRRSPLIPFVSASRRAYLRETSLNTLTNLINEKKWKTETEIKIHLGCFLKDVFILRRCWARVRWVGASFLFLIQDLLHLNTTGGSSVKLSWH